MSIHHKSETISSSTQRLSDDTLLENWYFFFHQTFARLKVKFLEREISQDELATRLGKNKAFISRCLRGRNNVTLKTMFYIASALGYRMEINFVDLKTVSLVNKKYEQSWKVLSAPLSATPNSQSKSLVSTEALTSATI
jgi:transcriptional regulator with XRE-family HTH domain